jgi:hypothetical protein
VAVRLRTKANDHEPEEDRVKTISVHLDLYAYARSTPPIARFLGCLTMIAPAFFHPKCL